jgi:hypothetical protein
MLLYASTAERLGFATVYLLITRHRTNYCPKSRSYNDRYEETVTHDLARANAFLYPSNKQDKACDQDSEVAQCFDEQKA